MGLFDRFGKYPVSSEGEGVVDNFSPQAQQVLALARQEARRLCHHFIGTEHLLLGIIRFGGGTAFAALRRLGLDPNAVGLEVEKVVGTGAEAAVIGNIPYTPRVKKALALATREAKSMGHRYCGTEHILVGLIREGDGVGARVLKSFGVDAEKAREAVIAEIEANKPRGG
jgi:ATP-dependent Clp protease ATP-binding subunit ClpC